MVILGCRGMLRPARIDGLRPLASLAVFSGARIALEYLAKIWTANVVSLLPLARICEAPA